MLVSISKPKPPRMHKRTENDMQKHLARYAIYLVFSLSMFAWPTTLHPPSAPHKTSEPKQIRKSIEQRRRRMGMRDFIWSHQSVSVLESIRSGINCNYLFRKVESAGYLLQVMTQLIINKSNAGACQITGIWYKPMLSQIYTKLVLKNVL